MNEDIYTLPSNIINNDYIESEIVSNSLQNNYNSDNLIIVYVCRAVKESKVVSLKTGSRISDAIEAVGGLTDISDLTNINLAYILEDGEKIYIPKKGEKQEDYLTDATFKSTDNSYTTSFKNQKININKATQTELETIPSIGPSTALKIINYRRDNGNFNSIEDIKNVSGIGDSKYNQIKEYICIK